MKTRYKVEWCYEIPLDEAGDAIHDGAKFRFTITDTFEKAVELAKSLVRGGKVEYGSVEIEFQELAVDADILENEGRSILKWQTLKNIFVDEPEYAYAEKEMEYVRY